MSRVSDTPKSERRRNRRRRRVSVSEDEERPTKGLHGRRKGRVPTLREGREKRNTVLVVTWEYRDGEEGREHERSGKESDTLRLTGVKGFNTSI